MIHLNKVKRKLTEEEMQEVLDETIGPGVKISTFERAHRDDWTKKHEYSISKGYVELSVTGRLAHNVVRLTSSDNQEINHSFISKDVCEVIYDSFPLRNAFCLLTYYGFDFTLAKVGAMLGVSTERVRQINAKSLRMLRHPSRMKRFNLDRTLRVLRSDVEDLSSSNHEYRAKVEDMEKYITYLEKGGHKDLYGKGVGVESEEPINPELETPLEDLDFSVRVYNALKRFNCHNVGDIVNIFKDSSVTRIRNIGKVSVDEIVRTVQGFGIKLNEVEFYGHKPDYSQVT